jgi:hypothetical protein
MQLRCGPISPDALPLDHAAVEQPAHGALAAPVALAQTMPPRRPQMERGFASRYSSWVAETPDGWIAP